MTLYEYIKMMPEGEELTVWDKDYDIETYFYSDKEDNDRWQKSMLELSKLLTITEIRKDGLIVNLADVIEKNISKLEKADLFIYCDIDSIMEDIENIISGYVSEEWMEDFVKAMST